MKKRNQLQRLKQNSDWRCSAVDSITLLAIGIKHWSEHFQTDFCSFTVEQKMEFEGFACCSNFVVWMHFWRKTSWACSYLSGCDLHLSVCLETAEKVLCVGRSEFKLFFLEGEKNPHPKTKRINLEGGVEKGSADIHVCHGPVYCECHQQTRYRFWQPPVANISG